MDYFYKKRGTTEAPCRASQRMVLDKILSGEELEVAQLGGKEWIHGKVFVVEGSEGFKEPRLDGLSPEKARKRTKSLIIYTIWSGLILIPLLLAGLLSNEVEFLVYLPFLLLWTLSCFRIWKGSGWAWAFGMFFSTIISLFGALPAIILIFMNLFGGRGLEPLAGVYFLLIGVLSFAAMVQLNRYEKWITYREHPHG